MVRRLGRIIGMPGIVVAGVLLALVACAQPAPEPTGIHHQPDVQESIVQNSDVELYVRIAGNAAADDVLLAVNMGPGLSSHYMVDLEELAGDTFAVVTYDQRGTGRSGQPSGGHGLLAYVEDLETVRQAAGAEQVYLLGHCWGGLVASRYATVYPDRVRSLVLWGGSWPDAQTVSTGQENLARRRATLQEQGIIPAQPTALRQILPVFLSDPGFELPATFGALEYDAAVEQAAKSALGEHDLRTEVAQLDKRVLFLWGADDPFGIEVAQASRDSFSAAEVEYVVLEHCGHLWQECAAEFFGRVRRFLAPAPAQ